MTTVKYLKSMEAFIRTKPYISLDTCAVQNDVRKELNESIPKLECFDHHWQSAMREHLSAESEAENLTNNTLMLITDFQQNISFPLAPQEGGRWWYANAQCQCIVLGVYAEYRDSEGTLRTKCFAFLCG